MTIGRLTRTLKYDRVVTNEFLPRQKFLHKRKFPHFNFIPSLATISTNRRSRTELSPYQTGLLVETASLRVSVSKLGEAFKLS